MGPFELLYFAHYCLEKGFLMILGAKIQSRRCARFKRTLLVENLKFAKCEFLWENNCEIEGRSA